MKNIDKGNFIKYLKEREEQALDYVIDHYSGLIRSIIRKHLGQMGEWEEECINDVLLAIWNNIERFDEGENGFKNWVAAISKYKSIDYKRKYMKLVGEQSIEELDDSTILGIDETYMAIELSEEINSIFKFLNEEERIVLESYYIKEEKIEYTAEKMGVRPSAIYNKLSRSRKKLRTLFSKSKEGGEIV